LGSARISAPAGLDLEEIFVYLEQEAGEERAAGVIDRILGAAEMLARVPRAGRGCEALLPG
jgi:plasmid stabilization system protein ParE